MVASISLTTHNIRVREKLSKRHIDFNKINGKEDFFDITHSFFNDLKTDYSDLSNIQKLTHINSFSSNIGNRVFSGIIESGEYGYESTFLNKKNKSTTFKRNRDDAEMLPFYFLLYLPANKNEGILFLQRFKQYGITTVFDEAINDFFALNYSDYEVEINSFAPDNLIQAMIANSIPKKARFIKYASKKKDIADKYKNPDKKETTQREYVVYFPKYGKIHRPLKDIIETPSSLNNLVEIDNFEYDTVKLEVKINNKPRTISLDNEQKMRPIFDITNEINTNASQHPIFESIDIFSKGFLEEFKKHLK